MLYKTEIRYTLDTDATVGLTTHSVHQSGSGTLKSKYILGICTMIGAVVVSVYFYSTLIADPFLASPSIPDGSEQATAESQRYAENQKIFQGGEHHKPLKLLFEYPGIEIPKMLDAEHAYVPESTPVVGIEVNGQYFAFALTEMLNPRHHIANLILGKTAISVTYCSFADCVRVLTDRKKKNSSKPIPLKVGGLNIDNKMVIEFLGERFDQLSDALPLADYPFKRMTLGDWQKLHPTTKVYLGPMSS